MKKNIILSIVVIVSAIVTLNSCKKKTEVDSETQSVVDNAICEQQFMAITPVVSEKGINESGIKRSNTSCGAWSVLGAISGTNTPNIATDTLDNNGDGLYDNGPVSFQIDYGSGCLAHDGLSFKTGIIKITTAKRWHILNNPITIDLVNYKINNVTYSGKIIITRNDSVTVTTQVINGHCSDGNWNVDYEGTKTIKQTGGYSTKNNEADDIIEITGSSSGKNRDGRTFTTNITTPLIKKSNCKFITSGTLDLTPDGLKTRTVDFGPGTCDDDATYTVNGTTISFKLK